MLHNALTWEQWLVTVTTSELIIGGILGFIAAGWFARRGKPYRPGRHPVRFAVVSGASVVVGTLPHFVSQGFTEPKVASFQGAEPTFSSARFDSSLAPAVAVEAPEGWRIEFDRQAQVVKVVKGQGEAANAPAVLSVDSSLLKDEAVPERLVKQMKPAFEQQGFSVEPAFPDSIGQAQAQGLVAHAGSGDLCSWVVKRGSHYVSSVQCFSRDGTNCRQACKPALQRLTWRRPSNVSTSDL
jgi:hypothetical protein